jgi:hypothetical protein
MEWLDCVLTTSTETQNVLWVDPRTQPPTCPDKEGQQVTTEGRNDQQLPVALYVQFKQLMTGMTDHLTPSIIYIGSLMDNDMGLWEPVN